MLELLYTQAPCYTDEKINVKSQNGFLGLAYLPLFVHEQTLKLHNRSYTLRSQSIIENKYCIVK